MTIDDDMLHYLNKARTNPQSFITLIQQQLSLFISQQQMTLTQDIIYQTDQGQSAWRQAILFLSNQKPLSSFYPHKGLNQACTVHAIDLCNTHTFSHTGTDGSSFSQRIFRYCQKSHGALAQIIGSDFILQERNIAQMTILGLIIDDGVVDRGHRKTIFSKEYKYVGCKSMAMDDKQVTVFTMSENRFELKDNPDEEEIVIYDAKKRRTSRMKSRKSSAKYEMNISPTHKPTPQRRNTKTPVHQQRVSFGCNNTAAFTNNTAFTNTAAFTNNTAFTTKQEKNINVKRNSREIKIININEHDNIHHQEHKENCNKKIKQKIQNIRTFMEDGRKKQITTIVIHYTDGTKEQNLEKKTFYD